MIWRREQRCALANSLDSMFGYDAVFMLPNRGVKTGHRVYLPGVIEFESFAMPWHKDQNHPDLTPRNLNLIRLIAIMVRLLPSAVHGISVG